MPASAWLSLVLALSPVVGAAAPADVGGSTPLALAADAAIASFSGTAGVVIEDPISGASYQASADRVFPSASLYKLVVMAEAYRAASAGALSLDESTVTIIDDDLVDAGQQTPAGVTLTVREAVERMITSSDNSAGRGLVRLLDAHSVNALAESLGLRDTRINTMLPEPERTDDFNTTSPRDMARLLRLLARGELVDAPSSIEMLATLSRQRINDRLPTGLPAGVRIAHKTGNLDGLAHDVGVITTPFGPRIVVLLSQGFADYGDVVVLSAALASGAFTLPIEYFAASISPLSLSIAAGAQEFTAIAQVRNDSNFAWDATFHVGVQWRDSSNAVIAWDGASASLPPLAPGQSTIIVIAGKRPRVQGGFQVLELDVVRAGAVWAGTPARIPVIAPR